MNAAIKQPNQTGVFNASFLEWCEVALPAVLEQDLMRTHESCWRQEPGRTLLLCLSFRSSQHRPTPLDQFHRMCAVSDDEFQALADGEVDTAAVIEIALFPAPSDNDDMPMSLRAICERYRAYILESAQEWSWVRGVYEDQCALVAMRARCRCGGDCICN